MYLMTNMGERCKRGNEFVFAMGNKTIYKYNKNGVTATLPLSIFSK